MRGPRAHHLATVLRVAPGQVFEVSDSQRLYLARVAAVSRSGVEFAIEEELPAGPALPPVTLLAAIFKFDRFEWMVEKATEVGAARLVPLIAARTEKALAAAAGKRVERWRRIAFEASQQSRRLAPLGVEDPAPFARAVKQAAGALRWMLDEAQNAATGKALLTPTPASGSDLLVGPEGGWTDDERMLAQSCGFRPAGMGPLILRAETAAVAALAVLLYANAPGRE